MSTPCASQLRRASASIDGETSTPTTRSARPANGTSRRPTPQPWSSTSAARTPARRCRRADSSTRSRAPHRRRRSARGRHRRASLDAGTPRPRRRRSRDPCGRTAPTAARGRARRVVLACARVIHVALNLVFLVPGETGGMEVYARELIPRLAGARRPAAHRAREPRSRRRGLRRRADGRPGAGEAAHGVGARGAAARAPHGSRGGRGPRPLARQHGAAVGPRAARHDDPRPQLQARAGGPLRRPRPAACGLLVPAAARRSRRIIVDAESTRGISLDALGHRRGQGRRRAARRHRRRRPSIRRRRTQLRERLGLGERPVVLSVSAKRPHKNLARLLRAVAAIPAERRPALVRARLSDAARGGAARPRRRAAAGRASLPQWVSSAELEGLYALATLCGVPVAVRGVRASRARGDGARRAGGDARTAPRCPRWPATPRCCSTPPTWTPSARRSSGCSADDGSRGAARGRRPQREPRASRGRQPPRATRRRIPPRPLTGG